MNPNDSDSVLSEKLLGLTYACPKGRYEAQCPFILLAGLSHSSREAVLKRMSRDELIGLFDLVPACRCPADPRHAAVSRPADGD